LVDVRKSRDLVYFGLPSAVNAMIKAICYTSILWFGVILVFLWVFFAQGCTTNPPKPPKVDPVAKQVGSFFDFIGNHD
jgi:hypothetical protein